MRCAFKMTIWHCSGWIKAGWDHPENILRMGGDKHTFLMPKVEEYVQKYVCLFLFFN